MTAITTKKEQSSVSEVIAIWLPLGLSWFLMALEGPISYSLIGRFPDPEVSIAAFGGVVLPITFIIEAAILAFLPAATALVKDYASYLYLRRLAVYLVVFLSLIHLLVAYTPLYDLIARDLIGVPDEVRDAARLGLQFMSPVIAMVAYRRFHQGVLISFGAQNVVGRGTILRLVVLLAALLLGYRYELSTGVAIASFALVLSLSVEAVYVGMKVAPIISGPLTGAPPLDTPLSFRKVRAFYFPLALNVILNLAAIPMYSAAISRMPEVIPSLATWSVVGALCFLVRSSGLALTEVTIAHSRTPAMSQTIRRFSYQLGILLSVALLLVGATPLSILYFDTLSGLDPALLDFAVLTTLVLFVVPFLSTIECFFQGLLINAHRTTAITLSVAIGLAVTVLILLVGIFVLSFPGTYVTAVAVLFGSLIRTLWLGAQLKPSP